MSTPEEMNLQLLHKNGEEQEVSSYPEGQKPQDQPDAAAKGAVDRVVTSRWKKISLVVLTLLGYTCVYATMSTVTTYYAIVVSRSFLGSCIKYWRAHAQRM